MMTSDRQGCNYQAVSGDASEFVIPPELVPTDEGRFLALGVRGESGSGPRGLTPESCFYKGWGRGYVQDGTAAEGTREDL